MPRGAPVPEPDRPLRRGWTTGACATAAAKAAWQALLTGAFPDPVTIRLPRGETPAFALARERLGADFAMAAIVKDAGDDPDVTHGAEIVVRVRRGPRGSGLVFRAGEGVGTVTRPGLPVPPGEPAINPVPRRMIAAALAEVSALCGVDGESAGDIDVTVAVTGGAALAERTWNPRLGILGGLSILGTTGVVVPYSCAAWIHAIHRGIDVARAAGLDHVAGATGNASEAAAKLRYALPDIALLDMGDFAGGMLKYLRTHPVPRLTIAGGFAKLAKLAHGALDLHSSRSEIDRAFLAELSREAGGSAALAGRIMAANTAAEALSLASAEGVPLASAVAERARASARSVLRDAPILVNVLVVDRAGAPLAETGHG
ncbi:cobalt-precorrin-5B (C(1))-methyltransferase [Faunimonas sp. B44]|uniref:cobalt-precorrin-5B (C(1))-methyltransferase n=1 Tax=Faunimonas sp. B44 TaxID=3461493 RepID=UPI004043F9D4